MNRHTADIIPVQTVPVVRTGLDIVLAFEMHGDGFFEKGIEHFTATATHHVEIWTAGDDRYSAACWGAREGGVGQAIINLCDSIWALFMLPPLDMQARAAVDDFLDNVNGEPYDYPGVEHFVFRFIHQNPEAWFCSELATEVLIRAGITPALKSDDESPGSMIWRLTGIWPQTMQELVKAADEHNKRVRLPGWQPAVQDPTDHYPGNRRPPK